MEGLLQEIAAGVQRLLLLLRHAGKAVFLALHEAGGVDHDHAVVAPVDLAPGLAQTVVDLVLARRELP